MAKIKNFVPGEVWLDRGGNECSYREDGSLRVLMVNNEPSLAIQSEKDNCDINLIVAKYKKTGLMTNVRRDQPMYGDFSNIGDFQSAAIALRESQEAFMTLPAALRKRFKNDPGELVEFLNDPNNRSEAIKLGLVTSPQDSQNPQGDGAPPSSSEGKSEGEGG